MKFIPYVWRNIVRNKPRFAMTLLSIVIAFFLLGTLTTLKDAFGFGIQGAVDERLITVPSSSNRFMILLSYFELIKRIPGVDPDRTTYVLWAGGTVGERGNWIAQWATDAEGFLGLHGDSIDIPQDQVERWLHEPSGLLVGSEAAELYDWEIGDAVQIDGGWRQEDSQETNWTFTVSGIYTPKRGSTLIGRGAIGHFDYHSSTRAQAKIRAHWFHIGLLPGANPAEVSRLIDLEFENSQEATQTTTERIFNQQLVRRFGDIGQMIVWVLIGTFATLTLVVGTTISLSIDERRNEYRLMRAVGYDGRLLSSFILSESITILLLGGIAGLGLAYAVVPILQTVTQSAHMDLYNLPYYLLAMVLIGVTVGVIPAIRASRGSRLTDMRAL